MPQTDAELRVDGIDDESDADGLEEQLLGTPGVTRVRVDADEGRVEARVNSEATDEKQPLRSILEELGYEVTESSRDPSV